jgi:hypothetical protein
MRHITTAAVTVTAAAVLALTGCSSTDSGKPAKPTPAATSKPKLSAADQIKACTDAIAAGQDEGDGAPECTSLSPDDYMKALNDANRQGQDKLQKRIDEASASAQP